MDDSQAGAATSDDIVSYFEALPPAARRELEALAARDREYGEDVQRELAARGRGGGS